VRPPPVLPGDTNVLFHNNGDGTFTDVSEKSGILSPALGMPLPRSPMISINDGWPDIYVAVDSHPSILFHNNHDGTFTDVAGDSRLRLQREWPRASRDGGVAVADYDC